MQSASWHCSCPGTLRWGLKGLETGPRWEAPQIQQESRKLYSYQLCQGQDRGQGGHRADSQFVRQVGCSPKPGRSQLNPPGAVWVLSQPYTGWNGTSSSIVWGWWEESWHPPAPQRTEGGRPHGNPLPRSRQWCFLSCKGLRWWQAVGGEAL